MRTAALFLLIFASHLAVLAGTRPCYPMQQATDHLNQDVCISAHVYDVIELPDGTRFLDVCSPETSDEECRFSVVSYREDRTEVGDLMPYKDSDVQIRGVIHGYRGRGEILLSHARQFHGGGEKFRPNPELLRGFSAEDEKTAFSDPALRARHHHRTFTEH